MYVDWLWFDGAGYRSVYSKCLATEAWLFVGGALIFLVFFGINTFWAARPLLRQPAPGPASDEEAATLRRLYLLALIAGDAVLRRRSSGTIAAGNWDTSLRFINGESFGMKDPQFGRDVGFYVFDLPALRFFYGWLMGTGHRHDPRRRRALPVPFPGRSAPDGGRPPIRAAVTWRCCWRRRGAVHLGATG